MIGSIAPGTEIADISHLIEPYGVRQGALVLAESVGWYPTSIHLAVVDPGVGSSRRALILSTADGSLLVGPDNGLLMPSAARLGGVEGVWQITNPHLGLSQPSATFHGRDVFAPAAAHLSLGVDPHEFGPSVDPESLVLLPAAEVEDLGSHLRAEVVQVDRFGNLQTNLVPEHIDRLGAAPGTLLELRISGRVIAATFRESYAYGQPGEVQLVLDSHGSIALGINRGSASAMLGARAGAEIFIGLPGSLPRPDAA